MGSLTLPKLPVIDFSKENLEPGTSSWLLTREDVRRALEDYGCFVAVYDKVFSEPHNSIFHTSMEELFDLPTETKVQNTYDKPYHGYVGQIPVIPLYESLGIDNATTLQGTQSFTNLMWPAGNDRFCESVLSYSKQVSELDQMVNRMVFESFGVEKYYDSHMESTNYLLRFMKYSGLEMNDTNVGFISHTDKSFLTILHQNQVKGLEIKTKDGEWIGFDPMPSSFVVMAGDAILAWSNGRIHSVHHRVVISESEARYSLGLFAFNSGMIQTPEELVDDEHPLKFKPFDHIEFLRFYYANKATKLECAITAYCGV